MAEDRQADWRRVAMTRRDLLRAATASVGTLALAACGGGPDSGAPAPAPAAVAPPAPPPPSAAPPPPPAPPIPPPTPPATFVYSTNFDLAENPLSEGGKWFNTGQLWTKVRTANGLAFGTNGATNTYDDSYAYLSGFASNQQGEAVVHVDPNLTGAPHEVELLLRWEDAALSARGYECLFHFDGQVQIMRWNGAFGDFTELSGTGSNTLGRNFVSGDVIKANIIGSTITIYVNGVPLYQAVDSTWTTGQPGIGFFKRTAGANTDFAITSYIASSF
jgi:hypothetical protein